MRFVLVVLPASSRVTSRAVSLCALARSFVARRLSLPVVPAASVYLPAAILTVWPWRRAVTVMRPLQTTLCIAGQANRACRRALAVRISFVSLAPGCEATAQVATERGLTDPEAVVCVWRTRRLVAV